VGGDGERGACMPPHKLCTGTDDRQTTDTREIDVDEQRARGEETDRQSILFYFIEKTVTVTVIGLGYICVRVDAGCIAHRRALLLCSHVSLKREREICRACALSSGATLNAIAIATLNVFLRFVNPI